MHVFQVYLCSEITKITSDERVLELLAELQLQKGVFSVLSSPCLATDPIPPTPHMTSVCNSNRAMAFCSRSYRA